MNNFEETESCIDHCMEEGENLHKSFKKTYKAYVKMQKQIVKFSECINMFQKVDPFAHPQISCDVNKNSEVLYQKMVELSKFIEVNLVSTKNYMDKYIITSINKCKSDFQSKLSELSDSCNRFMSSMCDNSQGSSKFDIKNGFEKHCDYICFVRDLMNIENELIVIINSLKTMIKEAHDFMITMRKTVNVQALSAFPNFSNDFKPTIDERYQTVIENEIAKLNKAFNDFKEPKISLQESYTFNNSQIKMMANNDILDQNGNVIFKENDIVKVLDASYADYWEVEVKKMNEQNCETSKMLVRVEDLKPYTRP